MCICHPRHICAARLLRTGRPTRSLALFETDQDVGRDAQPPPVVVPVPVGRESGPAAFEGMEYSLHRMRLVFRSAVASRRPRRIPWPPDSDAVRQALDDAFDKRRTPRIKARLDELAELVQGLGRYGLIELARERGAPDLASFKEDLWVQMDAFMPHAVLIDDDRFWLAVCNEVRAGNMSRVADFLSPPPSWEGLFARSTTSASQA
jgi:hypothetical protein